VTAPRLSIDLHQVSHNARTLTRRLADRGIGVVGVTKAALGLPGLGTALLEVGITTLGDSRIENIERLRRAGITAPTMLIRSPMLSQVHRVVAHAQMSCNTDVDVLAALSAAAIAAGRRHGVILMVELGDLREGILPHDLESAAAHVLRLANLDLCGIGTNLACQSGIVPDPSNMGQLSDLADALETRFGIGLDLVSGGNSANLGWALSGADVGRVNQVRLGESILLGRDPLDRRAISGLHTDAFTLVAEVIECKDKPSTPHGTVAQTAFGAPARRLDRGIIRQAIVALGEQDTDPGGLAPPTGMTLLGASSDHLVLDAGDCRLRPGDEIVFGVAYSALVRAMTSPFVAKVLTS
jgi:ornithine racemase